eukprot:TRINITY_DN26589_c0_g2_i1.p1 TRINITY_DN26589_c0_g2~~TRINITY_DN26589_c0_g2_i1.p1  ORF type:complete len:274 (+),score=60.27 TRINITY_DN26589_c0_g2_i1:111-932(+)
MTAMRNAVENAPDLGGSTEAAMQSADKWEEAALRKEFMDAVEHVHNSTTLDLPPEAQRRLFGLYCRAVHGLPPANAKDWKDEGPADGREERWNAWKDVEKLSEVDAMKQYIDVVTERDPEFGLFVSDDRLQGEAKDQVERQLEEAGIKKKQDEKGSTDIFSAIRDHASIVAFLPDHANAKCEETNLTPLMMAADSENEEAVDALLAAKADVNETDEQAMTALHYAAMLGLVAVAKKLIAAGIDVSRKNEDGESAGQVAKQEGHEELAELLESV